MFRPFPFFERHPLALATLLCAVPYAGLRLYLAFSMHRDVEFVAMPGPVFLIVLSVVGVATPAVFLAFALRRVLAEWERFELRALLELYASTLLVFAVTYALLQATGGDQPAFLGLAPIWEAESALATTEHVDRLHRVFGNTLYLSVVTMTTVGYGDIVPSGFLAKSLTAIQGLLGIGFIGLVLGQYFSSCLACFTDPIGGSARGKSILNE